MRTIAILPIKSFGAAKQRLAGLLGGGSREALAQAMFADVVHALRHMDQVDEIVVVTGNRNAESAVGRSDVVLLHDGEEAGQSAAAQIGLSYALEHGFTRALLVPGDTPLLDADEVGSLLDRAAADRLGAAIVPDRHGTGTNALLLSPPDAIEPGFGEDSLARHVARAAAAGIAHRVEELDSLGLDIDTPDDLGVLAQRIESCHGTAAQTRGALRQLGRSEARGPLAAGRPQSSSTARIRV